MKWIPVILVGVLFTVMGVLGQDVYADDGPVWGDGPYPLQSMGQIQQPGLYGLPCGGRLANIKVANYLQPQEACVYGVEGGVRMARFYNNQQSVITVISFPSEAQFYEVRGLCYGRSACLYSQEADKMYVVRQVSYYATDVFQHKDLTRSLARRFDPSILTYYYEFTGGIGEYAVSKNDSAAQIGNLAVSRNGRWVAVEYANRGILRIDTRSDEVRRVYPLDSRDMKYELAVSNDGRSLVATGVYPGVFMISIDSTCGDRLVDTSTSSYAPYVQRCHSIGSAIPNLDPFADIKRPDFIGDSLLYYRVSQKGTYYDVVLAASPSKGRGVEYIAVGDSFTSGEGELSDDHYRDGTNTKNNTCHVSTRSYPYLLPDLAGYPAPAMNVACSGAVIEDVLGGSQYKGQRLVDGDYAQKKERALASGTPGVAAQLEFIREYKPSKVTISIGGNDTGFMEKLKACISPGVCEWAKEGVTRGASAREIDQLHSRYVELANEIKRISGASEVSFVGYPRVIAAGEGAKCGTILGALLSVEERQFMDESVKRLNKVMRSAAGAASVAYLTVEDAYEGSKLCEASGAPAMNGLRLGDDIAPMSGLPLLKIFGAESFHPTPAGHRLVAETIGRQSMMRGFVVDTEQDDYWGTVSETGPRYKLLSPVHSAIENGRLAMKVREYGFSSGQTVSVRLQGTDEVYSMEVDESGVLDIDIPLLGSEDAIVKTVYISGKTASNEEVIGYVALGQTGADSSVVIAPDNPGVPPSSNSTSVLTTPLSSTVLPVVTVGPAVVKKHPKSHSDPKSVTTQENPPTNRYWWRLWFVAIAVALGIGGVGLLWWASGRRV